MSGFIQCLKDETGSNDSDRRWGGFSTTNHPDRSCSAPD